MASASDAIQRRDKLTNRIAEEDGKLRALEQQRRARAAEIDAIRQQTGDLGSQREVAATVVASRTTTPRTHHPYHHIAKRDRSIT